MEVYKLSLGQILWILDLILEKNLNHTSFRKTFEGLLITLKKPELNIQKSHKCQTFLCTCVIPDDSIT